MVALWAIVLLAAYLQRQAGLSTVGEAHLLAVDWLGWICYLFDKLEFTGKMRSIHQTPCCSQTHENADKMFTAFSQRPQSTVGPSRFEIGPGPLGIPEKPPRLPEYL